MLYGSITRNIVRLIKTICSAVVQTCGACLMANRQAVRWMLLAYGTLALLGTWFRHRSIQIEKDLNTEYPNIMWWTDIGPFYTNKSCGPFYCNIYHKKRPPLSIFMDGFIFYGPNLVPTDLPMPRRSRDVIWGLLHTKPTTVDNQEMSHESFLNLFNFSATFSRHSDVPFPLRWLRLSELTDSRYHIQTSIKNSLLDKIAPILYVDFFCNSTTGRHLYVKNLMKFIAIDVYSDCVDGKPIPYEFVDTEAEFFLEERFQKFMSRYKFMITIEDGVCDDYISKKFWRALKMGVVPIYYGSPLIRDWLPNNDSAILVEDFETPRHLSEYIREANRNDELYEKHLEHKTKGLVRNTRLMDHVERETHQTSHVRIRHKLECLVCQAAHAIRSRRMALRARRSRGASKAEKNADLEPGVLDSTVTFKRNVVDQRHYHCPRPRAALSQRVDPRAPATWKWLEAKFLTDSFLKAIASIDCNFYKLVNATL